MTWKSGQSGNPKGRLAEKPFADALRMELVEAGANHKKLRAIARSLLDKAEKGDLAAMQMVADRTDGKPAQTTDLNINDKRDVRDWTRDELTAFLSDAKDGGAGTDKTDGRVDKSDRVH